MFVLISPAKKLLTPIKPFAGLTTTPQLHQQAFILAQLMKTKSMGELATLMDLSHDLALLNYERYQSFSFDDSASLSSYPAGFLFQGDVYQGLQVQGWSEVDLEYAQAHLGILSGLYGLLRPLDNIQPYRLEMGVRLSNPAGETLYDYWRPVVTEQVNAILKNNSMLINLASNEYFKVIDSKKVIKPIIDIQFYEQKNGQIKMIGIYAKKARGVMAKFIVQNKAADLETLKQFNELGYVFNPERSSEQQISFIRTH